MIAHPQALPIEIAQQIADSNSGFVAQRSGHFHDHAAHFGAGRNDEHLRLFQFVVDALQCGDQIEQLLAGQRLGLDEYVSIYARI